MCCVGPAVVLILGVGTLVVGMEDRFWFWLVSFIPFKVLCSSSLGWSFRQVELIKRLFFARFVVGFVGGNEVVGFELEGLSGLLLSVMCVSFCFLDRVFIRLDLLALVKIAA